jgi:hypothetical protein
VSPCVQEIVLPSTSDIPDPEITWYTDDAVSRTAGEVQPALNRSAAPPSVKLTSCPPFLRYRLTAQSPCSSSSVAFILSHGKTIGLVAVSTSSAGYLLSYNPHQHVSRTVSRAKSLHTYPKMLHKMHGKMPIHRQIQPIQPNHRPLLHNTSRSASRLESNPTENSGNSLRPSHDHANSTSASKSHPPSSSQSSVHAPP